MKLSIIKFFVLLLLPISAFTTELEEKLFAVHATNYLIRDGVIRATFSEKYELLEDFPELKEIATLIPDFRSTVHFSLGSLSPEVNDGEYGWEECAFAVVTPISDLTPQLVNLNCYDTFILGNYELTAQATLILPMEYMSDEAFQDTPYKLWFYDTSITSLREAVDDVIADRGGWSIELLRNTWDDELSEAYLNGKNVNTPHFFQPLLQGRPYLAVGCRFESCGEGDAYLFGDVESNLEGLVSEYLPIECDEDDGDIDFGYLSKDAMALLYAFVQQVFADSYEALCEYVDTLPFDDAHKAVFERKKQECVKWMNILDADIHTRLTYEKTLEKAPLHIWKRVSECSSKEELNAYIAEVQEQLPAVSY